MSAALAQRVLLLAGATLVAAVAALAIAHQLSTAASSENLPASVPAPGGGWYRALAGPEAPRAYGRTTSAACAAVAAKSSVAAVLFCTT